MLEKDIKNDYLKFRKEKKDNLKDLLMIINWNIKNKQIELKKENLGDWEVLKILEKELKQLSEEKDILEKNWRDISLVLEKIEYIKLKLPEKMSEKELEKIILNFIKNNQIENILKARWLLFKYLKENFEWLYKPWIVNNILNNLN